MNDLPSRLPGRSDPPPALARPELAPLVDELVRRFGQGPVPAAVTLRGLPVETRHALADLFGHDRLPKPTLRVRVSDLLDLLDFRAVEDLRAAVESLRGPLPDRRAERLAQRAQRDDLWSWLGEEATALPLAVGTSDGLGTWVDGLRSQGARGGVEAHRRRLVHALGVLRALPADGVSLASLAADHLGDPHTLDRGRHVSTIVLDAVAFATGSPPASDAEAARQLWEAVGVAPDPLSSTVLALGLPGDDSSPMATWLAGAAVASEPVVLTLAQLRRWPLAPLATEAKAYVVENPSLVAEAATRAWTGPPLLCSAGRPTVAVVTALRQLGAAGATLYQHADFDAAGLAITAWLAQRARTIPWRMTEADYVSAATHRRGDQTTRGVLGTLPETPWDPPLRLAMHEAGAAVYEEQLRADLLASMG